jgi:hypothetical protein
MMYKTIIRVIVIIFAIIGVISITVVGYYFYITSPYEVTQCIESGGKWDEEGSKCVYE